MYKDKDKQREANRKAQAKFKSKGITQPNKVIPTKVIPSVIPKPNSLPDCVPEPVRSRYARGEPEYVPVIDRLLLHTVAELEAMNVWIPCWKYASEAAA